MKIERTFDDELVKGIMTLPELWATCAEEGQKPEDFEPKCEADCWLVVTAGDTTIGLYNLHPHNNVTLEIHAQILPQHRKEHSKESATAVLQWILDEAPEQYQKVIAQVPMIYPNVIRFTLAAGFIQEGVNRSSYRKGDNLIDQILLGITRSEIDGLMREAA